jgi:hypothetical protein
MAKASRFHSRRCAATKWCCFFTAAIGDRSA